jgi:hypothetical protein
MGQAGLVWFFIVPFSAVVTRKTSQGKVQNGLPPHVIGLTHFHINKKKSNDARLFNASNYPLPVDADPTAVACRVAGRHQTRSSRSKRMSIGGRVSRVRVSRANAASENARMARV